MKPRICMAIGCEAECKVGWFCSPHYHALTDETRQRLLLNVPPRHSGLHRLPGRTAELTRDDDPADGEVWGYDDIEGDFNAALGAAIDELRLKVVS